MRKILSMLALAVVAGCATSTSDAPAGPPKVLDAAGCAALNAPIDAKAMSLPSGGAVIESATAMDATPMDVAPFGPTPAQSILPEMPAHCQVLGRIQPVDPSAPPIWFQVNLPFQWSGRSVQYGGGGFNGTLVNALGLLPAARYEQPAPLLQGYVTVGTDSGHRIKPGDPQQAFALNDEALLNFAHASYKKVRDVSVVLMQRAYNRKPHHMYFVGSSEGGREGLTMAQRYPEAFDGIFSRVPVIHWTGLQHAGLRDGLALMGDAWIPPAKVKLVHEAVLAACDAADGLADGIVSDPVGCRSRFDVASLRCPGAVADNCLSDAQVRAVQTLNSPLTMPVELANGLRQYPGRGPSGEAQRAYGPMGGWMSWWTGNSAPTIPPKLGNGVAWSFGAGAIQYFFARDPNADLLKYRPEDHAARVREVSALMDSTNPDLSAFQARGGKLIVLEHLADYAQSPYAGIQYVESVKNKLGAERTQKFLRLFTAPGVDHVGSGAPANANFLGALVAWVETDLAPAGLTLVEQGDKPPFEVKRSRPLCEWPALPRYKSGDPSSARSFECAP